MTNATTERETLDAYNYTETEEAAVRAYADLLGEPVEDVAGDWFEDAWLGRWISAERYAKSFAETTGQIDHDDWLHVHVDWTSVVKDLNENHDFIDAPDGGVFVFRVI